MGIVEILGIFGVVLKFAIMIIEKTRKTPAEKRRESLAALDKAIEESHKKDLRDLSKWLGSRL